MFPTDLIAWVLDCRPLAPVSIQNHMGRAVQQFGLTQLGQFNPELAQSLHDDDDQKPLTVSGLMDKSGIVSGNINPDKSVWIRITGLSEAVASALLTAHTNM